MVSASGCSPVPKHRPHHRPRDRAVRHSAWPWAPILAFPEPPSQGLRSQVRCCRIATTDAVVVDARSAWLRPPLAWPPCKSRGHGLLQPSVRRSVGLAGHPVCAGVRCREDCCNHPRRWQAVRLASTSLRVTVFVGKNRKMLAFAKNDQALRKKKIFSAQYAADVHQPFAKAVEQRIGLYDRFIGFIQWTREPNAYVWSALRLERTT